MLLYFIVVFADIFKTGEVQSDATVARFAIVVNRGIRGEVTEAESSMFWYFCAEKSLAINRSSPLGEIRRLCILP